MKYGKHFISLTIGVFSFNIMACGGGGGDNNIIDQPEISNQSSTTSSHITPALENNQEKKSGTEEWRRIEGFKDFSLPYRNSDAMREYSENVNTSIHGVRRPEDYKLKVYYFNGENGLHRANTPGGGVVDYFNMSYATFGTYSNKVNNFYDTFYVAKDTHPDNIPITGSANYIGPVIFRGEEDGRISLNVNFSTRDITGRVDGLSLFDKKTVDIDASSYSEKIFNTNSIFGNLYKHGERTAIGIISAVFAGPNAEQIVGELSNNRASSVDYNNATFGATRQ